MQGQKGRNYDNLYAAEDLCKSFDKSMKLEDSDQPIDDQE